MKNGARNAAQIVFHARLGNQLLPDDVGVEVCRRHDLKRVVLETLRESQLDLSPDWTFEIVDESGELVMRVPIAELPGKH